MNMNADRLETGWAKVPAALLAAAPFVLAAGAAAADGSEGASQPKLETITVTADRERSFSADYIQAGTFRNAKQIDTPLTVTVIPKTLLDSQDARSILDALRNTAGVTTAQINGAIYNNLAIRGIAVENRGNYRLNGTLPVVNLIDLPLEDKARVEVLKGVSALYYGFTTPSGVVNLTTERPTAEPLLSLEAFGDSNGTYAEHADWSRTWGTFGVRANEVLGKLQTGIDRTDGHREFASVAADWRPTDKLTFNFDGEYIYKTISEPSEFQLPAAKNGVIPLPPLQDPAKDNLGANWMYGSGDEWNALVHMQYQFAAAWAFTLDYGISDLYRDRRYSAFGNYNLATGNGKLAVTLTNGNSYDNTIGRAELAGVVDTGFITHQLVFGIAPNIRRSYVPTNPTVSFAQNLYDPIYIPYTPLPPHIIPNPSKIDDRGYYAFDQMKVDRWAQILLGYRYDVYFDDSRTTAYHVDAHSPAYGLVLKPVSWVSVYGTYIQGLEEGGVAPANALNAYQDLPAASSTQREAGIKVQPIRTLLVTVAYFDIDRASAFLNGARIYALDGMARYSGIEYSVTGEITPKLSIIASGMNLDAKQISASTAAVIDKRIENTAPLTYSAYLQYQLPIRGLAVSAGAFYVGRRAVNAANNAFIGGYTTMDLGATYETDLDGHMTTFRVYGSNITNKWYWAATGSSLLAEGLPMVVKFTVSTQLY